MIVRQKTGQLVQKNIPVESTALLGGNKNSISEKVKEQTSALTNSAKNPIDAFMNYSLLFELAPIGLIVMDENGIIFNANKMAAEQLGVEKENLPGTGFLSYVENCLPDCNLKSGSKFCLGKEDKHRCEIVLRKKGGKSFDALLEIIKFTGGKDESVYFYVSMTNVSELKIHERVVEQSLMKEKNLNEMKSRFISLATHEFRTPMASILSSAWLLEKYGEKDDEEKKLLHIKRIKNSIIGLNDILNDFISLNMVENAMGRNKPVNLDLVAFIEQQLEEFRNEDAAHLFVFNHQEDHQDIFADRNLLKICLNNIIGNAIKYSPSKKKIEITTAMAMNEKDIVIAVKDDGIGIPDEEKSHVFEQFYRAKNADFIQGTGLGLHITKKMISVMGGKIEFTSEWNKGTTFFLTIPGNKNQN